VLSSGQYLNIDEDNETFINNNFERPSPDVPFCYCYNDTGNQREPSAPSPLYAGGETEGAIVEALWDIYDFDNDDNYYVGGNLWGHNNDHNASTSWLGFGPIFDAYLGYDPSPADAHHNHPWDIYEFNIAWQQLGYPIDQTYKDILASHSVDLCVFTVGDADGSGIEAISDAVYLISYIFSGGPAPAPHYRGSGDADCNGIVTLSDAVWLISFIFAGGNPPGATCDCNDFLGGRFARMVPRSRISSSD
jgi:hypothetical protein